LRWKDFLAVERDYRKRKQSGEEKFKPKKRGGGEKFKPTESA
jgi:hypothetical protein